MKHFLCLALALSSFLFASFTSEAQEEIISTTPIKVMHMGLQLGVISGETRVVQAIMDYTQKRVGEDLYYDVGHLGAISCVRIATNGNILYYGGGNWNSIDVYLNKDDKVAGIEFSANYQSIQSAKKVFKRLQMNLCDKYGDSNVVEDGAEYWTDGKTRISVICEESPAIAGNDTFFVHLSFSNLNLWREVESAMDEL